MSTIHDVALQFFEACEAGKGWDGCREYCHPNATFSCQADSLAEVRTVADYAEWMRGLHTTLPDFDYKVRFFAADEARGSVAAYAVGGGTHVGEGGPVPPSGQRAEVDYAYVMEFEGGRIQHVTKIWNDVQAAKQLGWV